MKLIHLSDLHLGKRLNDYSLLDDQRFILTKIINVIDDEKPDAVIIAGDVYDKPVPSGEAVELFDDFIVRLCQRRTEVFVISGNHDSPERLSFGSRIMDSAGIHLSPVYKGEVEAITLEDENGTVNFYMLPFVKPAVVRAMLKNEKIVSYTDGVREAISAMNVDFSGRNVLVTHQFVTGASRSESEEVSVGGADNVDASVFDGFDYVALGHIHSPQNFGGGRIRYCGTPLKYSFSEAKDEKSVTVIELGDKGTEPVVRCVPLVPKRDMKEVRGSFAELSGDASEHTEDYVQIILTDEEDIPDAQAKLRAFYPNFMHLKYDNTRTRSNAVVGAAENPETDPLTLFSDFYELMNNQPLSEEQSDFVKKLIEEIWEGEK